MARPAAAQPLMKAVTPVPVENKALERELQTGRKS